MAVTKSQLNFDISGPPGLGDHATYHLCNTTSRSHFLICTETLLRTVYPLRAKQPQDIPYLVRFHGVQTGFEELAI